VDLVSAFDWLGFVGVLLVAVLPLSFYTDFLPKLWRTWKGKRDKPESVISSIVR